MSIRDLKKGVVGPADLVDLGLLKDGDPDLAGLAGYAYEPRDDDEPKEPKPDLDTGPLPLPPDARFPSEPASPEPVPFLIPTGYKKRAEGKEPAGPIQTFDPHWPDAPTAPPDFVPLANAGQLSRLLARFDPARRTSRSIDAPRVVRHLARAQPLSRVPKREFPRPRGLQLVADRSPRLAPVWRDQLMAFGVLATPDARLWRFDDLKMRFQCLHREEPAPPKPEDGPLLAFTDLGKFGSAEDRRFWREFAEDFLRKGGELLAVVPCMADDIPRDLARLWSPVPWETPLADTDPQASAEQVEELLMLASPLSRLEPGLLRSLRRHCTRSDATVELMLWRHEALSSSHAGAASFDRDVIKSYRRRFATFARDEPKQASKAWDIIRDWRGRIGAEFMFEEIGDLPPDVRELVVRKDDVACARDFWTEIREAAEQGSLQPDAVRWLQETGHRRSSQSGELWKHATSCAALRRAISLGTTPETRTIEVSQSGASLHFGERAKGAGLARLQHADGIIEFLQRPLASFPPPLTTFRDALSIGSEGPEMVSLPTGSFLMGSPEDDEDAFPGEKPQHRVEIGYPVALAKHPVTFGQYDAFCDATGRERPQDAGFGRGRRPVINVSWDDARTYCDWLGEQTGEAYRLPSEAEWEYACRAGTQTNYWWGDEWDPGQANGREGGHGKSTEVGSYKANPWGLHDTHGNVDQWCEDAWHSSYEGASPDGSPRQASRQDGKTDRVIRGGSWNGRARDCQAAFRGYWLPVFRGVHLGFRPARGQAGAQAGGGGAAGAFDPPRGAVSGANEKRPARGESSPPQRGGESSYPSEPRPLRVVPGGSAPIGLDQLPPAPFVIRTDRADLEIQRLTRTDLGDWASGMGRDRFGLWASLTVGDICQRMRFCPPGRFRMGSPKDEPGRDDDEGPQTEVALRQGFWLFDTPVTQELFEAVTAKPNPSRFISPARPVEQVTLKDAQGFIGALNNLKPGLDLRLPSEAEWEYACRAGTRDATYAGAIEILGKNNAPVLDKIAWYGGNSGQDFELDDGHDSSAWPEKQFRHSKAGTMPVKLKRANPWGLHDMLGNVWEWCEDTWHDSHGGASPDGSPRQSSQQNGESRRVIRGGSWLNYARHCRAAFRSLRQPGPRYDDLGFRPARGQAGAQAGGGGAAGAFNPPRGAVSGANEKPPARGESSPPQRGGESNSSRSRKRFRSGNDD